MREAQSFPLKLCALAAIGFMIAAVLVFVPGSFVMRPSIRGAKFYAGYWDVWIHYKCNLNEEPPPLLEELQKKCFWLCIAQNEVDSLPFLFAGAAIGPAILLLKKTRR